MDCRTVEAILNKKTYTKKVGKTVSSLRGSWEDNEYYLFGYILFITIQFPQFGKPIPQFSMITNTVVDYIYLRHGEKITRWNYQLLSPGSLRLYADTVHRKGAALENCVGFVDGTVRQICRRDQMQRAVYNGHKRVHALKFQSVTLPNRIIANMLGAIGM